MRGFRFSLEPVRQLRERAEEQARQQYGIAARRHADSQADLAAASQRLAAAVASAEHDAPSSRHARQAYIERLERERLVCQSALADAQFALDAARRTLVDAQAAHESVIRVRDRRLVEHRADLERREMAALDDIAGSRHHRHIRGQM